GPGRDPVRHALRRHECVHRRLRVFPMRSSTMFQKTARLLLLGGLGLFLSHAARAAVAGPYSFFPLTPCRVLDTRGPVGPQGGPALSANTVRNFSIINVNGCGVPG